MVDGNKVHFNKPFTGTLTFTLTAGESTAELEVDCKVTSVVNGVTTVESEAGVVKKEYFTTSGVKVDAPKAGEKAVYVVVKTYKDGSKKSEKVVL